MNVAEQLQNILALWADARQGACTQAALLQAKDLIVDERVRFKCRENACGHYGKSWCCPPHVPPLDECRRLLARYQYALVLQMTAPARPEEARAVFEAQKQRLHSELLALETAAFRYGFSLPLGLTAGRCLVCDRCSLTEGGSECRQPRQARYSMEALGLNIQAVCEQAALPAGFIPGEVTATALLLID